MTIEEIERLLRRLERTDITEVEIADETCSLKLRLASGSGMPRPAATMTAAGPTQPGEVRALRAGAIGLLRLRHPDAASDDGTGFPRAVAAGDIVAYLEAGPCLRPVTADVDCTIGPPFEEDGSLVGYGTPLFPIL